MMPWSSLCCTVAQFRLPKKKIVQVKCTVLYVKSSPFQNVSPIIFLGIQMKEKELLFSPNDPIAVQPAQHISYHFLCAFIV